MRTPEARRRALIRAGFVTKYRGRKYPDIDGVAAEAECSKTSIYYWINGTAGRFVDAMVRKVIADRQTIEATQ